MGVVQRAFDRQLGREVAVKTLPASDPSLLYSLKEEFRAVASLTHPNLVQHFELFVANAECFFTMEVVEGIPLVDYVRKGWTAQARACESGIRFRASTSESVGAPPAAAALPSGRDEPDLGSVVLDGEARSRFSSVSLQLITAVAALHDAGRLHCDIKPSNILVTEQGRLVLLDFGLSLPRSGQLERQGFAGTLAYAAPEQFWEGALTEATDWYAVGLVLYKALTGTLPGEDVQQLARHKPEQLYIRPEQLSFAVPPQVLEMITALLQPTPERRPSREALSACFGQAWGTTDSGPARGGLAAHFVGRAPELRVLHRAFESARAGWLSVVDVPGESGIGKTELVRQFTLDVARQGTLVVHGQCRVQESVAYQALDQVVDELSEYLLALPADERAALLGRDFASLVQAFPVLGRVSPPGSPPAELDAHALRQRATTALCELLWRICGRQPVVLWIDDTHWGDPESEGLLCDLLRAPAVPLLVILSRRQGRAPWADAVSEVVEQAQGQWIELPVERLDMGSSERLAAHLLGRLVEHRPGLARRVATESAHVPLFIGQLCRLIAETSRTDSRDSVSPLTLREVIERRLLALTEEERRVTALVALIETPLPLDALMVAAGLVAGETPIVSRLVAAKFLSLSGSRTETRVASFHHHVRETILEQLDATAQERGHRLLASALEALGPSVEPEILLHHLLGAHARHHALALALRAAEAAMQKSAFAHAATLYRTALSLLQRPSERHALVHGKLADALAAAGRAIEAGREYLALASEVSEAQSVQHQQRAAENFLVGGALEQGRAVLERALHQARLRLPASSASAVWHGLGQLARFELGRAIGSATAPACRIDTRQAARTDLCLSAAKGLGVVDPMLSAHFAFRALNVARQARDPARLGSALCLSGMLLAALGGPLGHRGEAWLDEADALAAASGDALSSARGLLCRAQVELNRGSWNTALRQSAEASRLLERERDPATWERNMANVIAIRALEEVGELKRAWTTAAQWHTDAQKRGDLYAETTANLYLAFARIADDRAEDAEKLAALTLQKWSSRPPPFQEFYRLRVLAYAELYRRRLARALALSEQAEQTLREAQLHRFPLATLEVCLLRARLLLCMAQDGHQSEQALRACEKNLERLERLRRSDASGHAALLRAGVDALRGCRVDARRLLATARAQFGEQHMALGLAYVSAATQAIDGRGSDVARELEADQLLRQQGIVEPRRWLAFHAPGFRH